MRLGSAGRALSAIAFGSMVAITLTPASASPKSLTTIDNVQACRPLPGSKTLVATLGGLALVGASGAVESTWTRSDGLLGTRVYAIEPLSATRYWIGTERGLHRISITKEGLAIQKSLAGPAIRSLIRHEGALFVGSWGRGVMRLDEATATLVPVKIAGGATSAVQRITSLASHGGALYAGTAGAGLLRSRDGRQLEVVAKDMLPSPFVWSIASFGGTLWIATLAGLVTRSRAGAMEKKSTADTRALLPQGRRMIVGAYGDHRLHIFGASSQRALPLGRARTFVNGLGAADGALCVATRAGLLRSRQRRAFQRLALAELPSNDISALLSTRRGLLIGTFDRGLARRTGGKTTRLASLPDSLRVNAMAQSADLTIWIATPRGLYRVDPLGRARLFGKADGLPSVDVHALHVLGDQTLVAGTGRGVVLVRGDRVRVIGRKQGLPVAAVWAIAEGDNGTLYLGTSHGLYHWSAAYRRGFRRYCVASGHLKDDWVTAIVRRKKTLYVGTYNSGVARLAITSATDLEANPLGGGWINVGGLHVARGQLWAATMSGLRSLPLGGAKGSRRSKWIEYPNAAPGRDVTGVAQSLDGTIWVASRRGIAPLP